MADLLKTLGDVKSRINIGDPRLSPILEGVNGSKDLSAASDELRKAKQKYVAAVSLLENSVRSWSGDDPVTQIYSKVFDEKNIISPPDAESELVEEWDLRRANSVPPGYKDGAKEDTGIGDFLIWKSILHLGAELKRDLIFVTGDEKADWFVRSNGGGAYPRPELIAEYKKFSGGKNFRLASLHDILLEMEVSKDFASEVERAEDDANNTFRLFIHAPSADAIRNLKTTALIKGKYEGQYETLTFILPYGGTEISIYDQGSLFKFQVSEAGHNSLWVYPNSTYQFFFVGHPATGQPRDIKDEPSQHAAFRIEKDQRLFVRSKDNAILGVRLNTANVPKFDENFVISFAGAIFKGDDS